MRKVCFDCNYETGDDIDCCPKCGKKLLEKKEENNFFSSLDTWPANRFFYIGLCGYIVSVLLFLVSIIIYVLLKPQNFSYSFYKDTLFLAGFVALLFGRKFHPEDKKINILFWVYVVTLILFVLFIVIFVVYVIINFPELKDFILEHV